MICSLKPVLTEDRCLAQKEEFLITCYLWVIYSCRKAKHIHKRETQLLVREDVISGLLPQEFSWKQSLVMGLKGPGGKMNWLAIDCDEKGILESETVKYMFESHGTRTREWLHWRRPAAIVSDRPVLSSKGKPHIDKPATNSNKNLVVGPRWVF
jgi:hypothetical protein